MPTMTIALPHFTYLALFPLFLLTALLPAVSVHAQAKLETRKAIGPVYGPPLAVGDRLYFLASTGVLYEADRKMESAKPIFKIGRPSVSELVEKNGVVFFGEGLHEKDKSEFFAFDTKSKKQVFKISLPGHVEKRSLVLGDRLLVPAGPGGLIALSLKDGRVLWRKGDYQKKKLHVDSFPVAFGPNVCAASIYETKAVFCVEAGTGRDVWITELTRSPKADLVLAGDRLVVLATEGTLVQLENREEPTEFITLEASTGRYEARKKIRGFTLYPQAVRGENAFVTLSSGDVLELSLAKAEMRVFDQFPEPLMASSFFVGDLACAVSSYGRMVCYGPKGRAFMRDTREITIGRIGEPIDGQLFLPTRIGYTIMKVAEITAPTTEAAPPSSKPDKPGAAKAK